MPNKINFTKALPAYRATKEFTIVDVPEQQYLMIDGLGDPNASPSYADALATLYPVAYGLKFASLREFGRDYVVPPLEGLWWADDMAAFTSARDKTRWRWTMMILTPDWLDHDHVVAAVADVGTKKKAPRLGDLRLARLREGRCVQVLHVGSFDDEGPVLERLHHEYLPGHGLALAGTHHEIYLSDPRRTLPEKLRTILRQPVRAAD